MDINLLWEGFLIMVIGMGFVYFFLCVMIFAMGISAKVIKFVAKFAPEEVEEDKYQSKKKSNQTNNDAEIAVAIACVMAERSKAC